MLLRSQKYYTRRKRDSMKQQDTYGEPTIFEFPGMTVRVYRPILTDEERAKRMEEIKKAAAALLISEYERKKREKSEQRGACKEDTGR
nr:MAG TPA: hypothetical protein [Caudoviricetes sp.]